MIKLEDIHSLTDSQRDAKTHIKHLKNIVLNGSVNSIVNLFKDSASF